MQQPILKLLAVLFPLFWLVACASLPDEEPEPRIVIPMDRPHQGSLSVLSLNLAHGRKDAVNQLFLSREDFENNLSEIADLIIETDADIVALQEADGPSRWSGGFDHVAALAEDADYPWFERASHAQGWLFDYGTALLSRQSFEEVLNHTFDPSPPTMNKGLMLGQIAWQKTGADDNPLLVDIISVHLDFSRRSIREKQIEELGNILECRKNPVVILGDFNSDPRYENAGIALMEELIHTGNAAFDRIEIKNTYNSREPTERLDYIFYNTDFIKEVSAEVVDEFGEASDHLPVLLTFEFNSNKYGTTSRHTDT